MFAASRHERALPARSAGEGTPADPGGGARGRGGGGGAPPPPAAPRCRAGYEIEIVFTSGSDGVRADTASYS
jgi:hypothetical protein